MLAVSPEGDAIIVWSQTDGTRKSIWASHCTSGIAWDLPVLLETDDTGDASRPDVAMDAAGNALAIWRQHDGTRNRVWARRYVVGMGWVTAAPIDHDNVLGASVPRVRMDSAGNATAIWLQYVGSYLRVWANVFTVSSGWQTAVPLETTAGTNAENPTLGIDRAGNATVVWEQTDGIAASIWASRYAFGRGWNSPSLLESSASRAIHGGLALDALGNAFAVWSQSDGLRDNIWAARFTKQ
jgi:hypothetical protein